MGHDDFPNLPTKQPIFPNDLRPINYAAEIGIHVESDEHRPVSFCSLACQKTRKERK